MLVHQDVEIVDPSFSATVARRARRPRGRDRRLRRGRSASAASPGGRARSPGPRSPSATRSSAAAARSRASPGGATRQPSYVGTGEVDAIDGCVIVLSPWAVRNLRFDEALGPSPRLRRRHLPPGARGGAKGRHRRPAGRPPPLARPPARSRGVDPGPHRAGGEVGRGSSGSPARTATEPSGAGAPCAPRRRRPPTGCGWARPSSSETMPAASCSSTWSSPSWTLTEPLRRLGARLRRPR